MVVIIYFCAVSALWFHNPKRTTMNTVSENTYTMMYRFLNGDVAAEELEGWITTNRELENEIGSDVYETLIAMDYRTKYGLTETRRILATCIGKPEFIQWKVERILQDIISKKLAVYDGLVQLTELYRTEGIEALRDFAALESAMEDVEVGEAIGIPDELMQQLAATDWDTLVTDYSSRFLERLCNREISLHEKGEDDVFTIG